MSKVLGLDLGTNSIGWAVVESDVKNGEIAISKLNEKGVIIFQEGVKNEKGNEKSKASERTGYRSARRLIFRRKLRKYKTLLTLSKYEMCPLNINDIKKWKNSNFKEYPKNKEFLNWLKTDDSINKNPYYFRDQASRGKIEKLDLGRAFYHIAQRRGFLSNRLDASDNTIIEDNAPQIENIIEEANNKINMLQELNIYFNGFDKNNDTEKPLFRLQKDFFGLIKNSKEDISILKDRLIERLYRKENLGLVKQNIFAITEKIKEGGFETLGQYFYSLYSKEKIRKNYTGREEHYLKEFELICKTQGLEGIHYGIKDPDKKYYGIVKELYKAIFFQGPLKSQKELVGKCSFEKNKPRCSVSHPLFEEFRMWQLLNNIKIKTKNDDRLRFLHRDEKERIITKFYRKSKPYFDFIEIKKELGINNVYNYKDNVTISACPTSAQLKSIFGDNWKEINIEYTTKDVNGNNIKRHVDYHDIWHILFTYTSIQKLEDYAVQKLKLDNRKAKAFSKIHLKKEYANLSLKAIKKILPYLKKGYIYSHAVFMSNMDKVVDSNIWNNDKFRNELDEKINMTITYSGIESQIIQIINGILKTYKDKNEPFKKERIGDYKNLIRESLEQYLGKERWKGLEGKEYILNNAFSDFIKHYKMRSKKGEFIKAKRLDEKIKDLLLGYSEGGVVYCSDERKLDKLYHPSDIETFKPAFIKGKEGYVLGLGSPQTPSVRNPMAMRSLFQLRNLINSLLIEGKVDRFTKINIELARELNDANKRAAIRNWQKENEVYNKKISKRIKEYYAILSKEIEPTENDILKYKLWEEQNEICLYTGKKISISDFIGANPKFDIEHTIPRSVSEDNSQMNKTLCDINYNRNVKKNKMPNELPDKEVILQRIEHWKKKYENLESEISRLIRATKTATTKEQKDRIIQKRHRLSFERDYFKGKYERFIIKEINAGFKNSQKVDIGIISKYARAYLSSVFERVYSVKGSMTAEFRKAWGLQESFIDEFGQKQYKPKERSKHIHHCIDAVTIACMDKKRYDALAYSWGLEEKGDLENARKILKNTKPWPSFTQDMKKLEEEVFVVHRTKDNVGKQTKKKWKKRGIIQRNDKGNTIFLQGDTVRGPLHRETFYGAIAQDANGTVKRDKNGKIIPNFVVRRELTKLKKSDIEKIVDPGVRIIVKKAVENGFIKFGNSGAKIDDNVTIWQNEAKKIPLKKVRVYTPYVKSPLKNFKKQRDESKQEYKREYHVDNDENYCMAIYENAEKNKRSAKIVTMLEAGQQFKLSVKKINKNNNLVNKDYNGQKLKYILTKGMMVLLYDKTPLELKTFDKKRLIGRLFEITQLDKETSGIKLLHHQEAREKKEITKAMGLKIGMKGGKNIDQYKSYPWIKVSPNNFDVLVEGYDFNISITGEIEFLG